MTTTPEDAAASMSTNVVRWPRTKPVVYEPADTRVSEMYATADAINEGLRMVEQRDRLSATGTEPMGAWAGCSGPCANGTKLCLTPQACQRAAVEPDSDFAEFDRRMPGLRASMGVAAYMALGRIADALRSPSVRIWLALLSIPALVVIGGLAAFFWSR
jgi:hypothetical protein